MQIDTQYGEKRTSFNNQLSTDSGWNVRKLRFQSDKDIDLLNNRLQLLKREEEVQQKRIDDTKKKTCDIMQRKKNNQESQELKKNSKRSDIEQLKQFQMKNYCMKQQQQLERGMMREVMITSKKQESDNMKQMSARNQKMIDLQKTRATQQNKMLKEKMSQNSQQSRLIINAFWATKIEDVYNQNQLERDQNRFAHNKNGNVQNKLEEQEIRLITRLQQSQSLQDQLKQRLTNALNMPTNQYKKIYGNDDDILVRTVVEAPNKGQFNATTSARMFQKTLGNNNRKTQISSLFTKSCIKLPVLGTKTMGQVVESLSPIRMQSFESPRVTMHQSEENNYVQDTERDMEILPISVRQQEDEVVHQENEVVHQEDIKVEQSDQDEVEQIKE